MGVGFVVGGKGHEKRAFGTVFDRPFDLPGRHLGIAHRDVGNRDQAAVRVSAKVFDPAVIGPGVGRLQLQVVQIFGLPQQSQAGIDDRLSRPSWSMRSSRSVGNIEPNGAWPT